jgi:hypothetical protein
LTVRAIAVYAVIALISALLAIPALASAAAVGSSAAPGGSPLAPGSRAGATPAPEPPIVLPGDVPVSASASNMTLSTYASAMLRGDLKFSGVLPRGDAGRTVEIDRLGHQTGWQWAETAIATVSGNGTFSAVWSANHIGRFLIRASISRPGALAAASVPPTVTVTVYRRAIATEYGPGFYGRRTACGKRLRRSTIGVANRTLRCGTEVALYYQGRTMVVPVIDRGPYAHHADWDLTEATARAIGLPGMAKIGAVSLPREPPLP